MWNYTSKTVDNTKNSFLLKVADKRLIKKHHKKFLILKEMNITFSDCKKTNKLKTILLCL